MAMPEGDDERVEPVPGGVAFAFLVTMVASMLILALLGVSFWPPAQQSVAVVATFAVSAIVAAQFRRR